MVKETSTPRALLYTWRPKQWTKNSVLFVGLVFSLNLFQPRLVALTVAAFALFCLLSGAIYTINDLVDLEQDRQHPLKRHRPLASGALSPKTALLCAAILVAVALPTSFWLSWRFGLLALAYLGLMVAYSFWLKNLVILDVFAIAGGFVLRVVAGAAVIGVPVSPWLYACTILGALFLGFTKRRHELVLLNEGAPQHRPILQEYTVEFLEGMIAVVTSGIVMAYSLYTFSAENLPPNHAMMLTIPFVLYGIFRYLYLIHLRGAGGSPEEVLLSDRPLLISVALWGLTAIGVLYFFR